jgi:hypothetical protein
MSGHQHADDFRLRDHIKVKSVDLPTATRIAVFAWLARRLATRATPLFFVLLLVLGMPIAFVATTQTILAVGAGLAVVVYAANRHVKADERAARQWAGRMAMLPVLGTGWVMLWHVMHREGRDVVNETMLITYWLYACLTWAVVHTADLIGTHKGWERLQRDFAAVGKRAGLAGATVVRYVTTPVGWKRLIDVRGTGRTAAAIAKEQTVADQLAAAQGLAPGSVRVTASDDHAGYVEVNTYTTNPWAHPIPHPRGPEFAPSGRRSPDDSFPVGIDPETGEEIPFRIANDDGAVHWLIVAGTGGGKMLALDTPIPTPSGWTTMGEVKDGDLIFDETGAPTTVVKAHPITHGKPTYEVEFDDGSLIVACGEHLWATSTRAQRIATSPDRIASRGTTYYSIDQTARLAETVDRVLARPDRQVGMGELRGLIEPIVSSVVAPSIAEEIGSDGKVVVTVPYRDGTRPRTVSSYSLHRFAKALHERLTKVRMSERFADRTATSVVSTDQIRATLRTANGHANHSIVVAQALQYPEATLPLDPYLFGAWLGDGSSRAAQITSTDQEILDTFDAAGYPTKLHHGSRGIGYGIGGGFTARLRAAGMSLEPGCKHVPATYLRASIDQRRALLAGLLDTDGHCNDRGQVEFAVTHKPLADGFLELVLGLGYKATMRTRTVKAHNGIPGRASTAYTIKFTAGEVSPFRLARKVARHVPAAARSAAGRRYIVDVRPVESVPMRCLTVDGPSRLYLAGRTCIPTHNTNLINNIVEHLTDCTDEQGNPLVEVVMIDMLKGHKDAANWAPAVHRVYPGPDAVDGAIGALRRAAELIPERARLNGQRGLSKHVPTAAEPRVVVIVDEASSLLGRKDRYGDQARKYVQDIFRGGRSEGISLLLSGQRAVLAHLGVGDAKANAFGIVVLPVRKPGEMTLAIPDWQERGMPDMSKFGRGAKGVALVALDTKWWAGRMFALHDVMTVRRIAHGRVLAEHRRAVPGVSPRPPEPVTSSGDPLGLIEEPDLMREPPADGVDDPDPVDLPPDIDEHPGLRSLDAAVEMSASVERLRSITGWAAAREAARSPQERAMLVEAWRRRTVEADARTALPEAVNVTLRDLAITSEPRGFTRQDARRALNLAGASTGKETINRYLRVLVSQGHLRRSGYDAPGRGAPAIYRLAVKEIGDVA